MININLRFIFGSSILVLFCGGGIIAKSTQSEFLEFFDLHEPRIINGTAATLDASRHQVSIRKKGLDGFFFGTGHVCGGSLISENVVLSAAHCFVNYLIEDPRGTFYNADYFIAVMGDLDRFNISNHTLIFDIISIVKRVEIFNLQTYQNDIVLLMLNGKVPAKHPTVRPVILNDGPLANNTLCQATGWGKTEEGIESDVLLAVDLPIIVPDDCRAKTLYKGLIIEGMICAGYLEGERDSCTGDSGGPLVCEGVQAAIISWGSGCAQALAPGVCTDIAFHKDWILKEVANHNGTLPKFASINKQSNEQGDERGDEQGDGATSLSCSLMLTSLMLTLNFYLYQTQ